MPRFPITLWPEHPLPEPLVSRAANVVVEAQTRALYHPPDKTITEWVVVYRGAIEEAPLPPELFLRQLLDVDPLDGHSVVEFVKAHGVIGRGYETGEREIEQKGARLNDVARYLATAQALSRQWLATSEGATHEELLLLWGDIEGTDGRVHPESDPWSIFARHLNRGLSVISPRVESTHQGDAWSALPEQLRSPRFGLYGGLCVQLFNALVNEETPRRCQNETCSRAFVRQQGGAEYGQHRTIGVLYCTPGCARAQAQREYRRRKRAGREGSQP